jgi:hypothetical protein
MSAVTKLMTAEYAHSLFEYRDGKLFWKNSACHRIKPGDEAGTDIGNGRLIVRVGNTPYLVHRIIFMMHHGYMPNMVDHINRNQADNRIENLREATKSENSMNRPKQRNNTSGTKGVSWSKQAQKWHVRVTVNKKCINIGQYKDLELAELVSVEAQNKYHGEFSYYRSAA